MKTAVANFLQLCENGLLYIATSGHTAAVTFKNKIFVWIWNSAVIWIISHLHDHKFWQLNYARLPNGYVVGNNLFFIETSVLVDLA